MPHKKYPATSSAQRCTFHLGEGSRKTAKSIAEENQRKQYECFEYKAELYQSAGKEQVIIIINTRAYVLGKRIRCFPHSGQHMIHTISLSVLFCPKDTAYQAEESVLSKLSLTYCRQLPLTFPTPPTSGVWKVLCLLLLQCTFLGDGTRAHSGFSSAKRE